MWILPGDWKNVRWKRPEKSMCLGLSASVSALGKMYVREWSSEASLAFSLTDWQTLCGCG